MKIFAVDFDGVITRHNRFPHLGDPNIELIEWLKRQKEDGVKLILWTCREGWLLEEAVTFCQSYGLEFDAINANLPEVIKRYGGDNRKVFAHMYIDDCCKTPWEIIKPVPKSKVENPVVRRKSRIVR